MNRAIIGCGLILLCLCSLKITQPITNPFPYSELGYSIGNFGDIPYGKTLSGVLQLYPQPDLCSTSTPLTHSQAILVTLRGNCSFVTKAINAQSVGAKMLIIADNINETKKIIMADDGRGRLVHIPAVFVNYTDGLMLIDFIGKAQEVKVMMKLEVNQTDKAEVRLWVNAGDRESYVLVRQFYEYYSKLQDWLKLNVSYYSMQCESCPKQDCYLYNSSYCQIDTSYHQPGSGQAIIQEQFRQLTIFRSSPDMWFQYMDKFDQKCMKWREAEECSRKVLQELGLTVSTNTSGLDKGLLLESWSQEMVEGGVSVVPDATINGINYLGSMDAQDIAEMVCASLKQRPQGCSQFFQVTAPTTSQSFSVALAVITVLFIVLVICGIIIIIYKRTVTREITNQMSTKVKEMVTKYATLVSEHEKKGKEREIERSREDL